MNLSLRFAWIVSWLSIGMLSTIAIAESPPPAPSPATPDVTLTFNAPSARPGAPRGRRRGGAGRDACRAYEGLTALVPDNGSVGGLTGSDRPQFWFYVPTALTAKTSVRFMVQDAQDQPLHTVQLQPTQNSTGLMQFSLPTTAKPLEIGKPYTWTLWVYCDAAKPKEFLSVQGRIQRVALKGTVPQLPAPTLKTVEHYAEQGIWYDAFSILAELRRADPQNQQYAAAWQSLLNQVKLESVATAPFSTCCQP